MNQSASFAATMKGRGMKKGKKGMPPAFVKKGKKPAMKKVGDDDKDMAMLKRKKMPA